MSSPTRIELETFFFGAALLAVTLREKTLAPPKLRPATPPLVPGQTVEFAPSNETRSIAIEEARALARAFVQGCCEIEQQGIPP
jgi:hypothetical protein